MNEYKTNLQDINLINSVLSVKASGAIADVSADLMAEQTKSIAQLLHEETSEKQENETTN